MKTAYLDCFSGISGDMVLGALVHLGADLDSIRKALDTVPIHGFHLRFREVKRCGIAAAKIDVDIEGAEHAEHDSPHREVGARERCRRELSKEPSNSHTHPHDSAFSAAAAPSSPNLAHLSHPHHSYGEIESILDTSGVSTWVKERAARAYRLIAEAESRVHHAPLDNIHFHEVGSIDAIVDVVGAFVAMELLGIAEVFASEITTGFGTIHTAHGMMPVPAPATAEILAGVPLRRGTVESEMVTPTGAAILRAACDSFGSWPEGFHVDRIGYGAGSREFPGHMNCLRVFLGHRRFAGGRDKPAAPVSPPGPATRGAARAAEVSLPMLASQVLSVVQTEIDDMSGEVYSHLMKRLFELGSHDVTLTPIQMKKNRPGVRVEVLCGQDRREAVVACLLRETTTFGVKIREVERICLDRRFETVQTPYGTVRVKIGLWNGEILKAAPEYEDCHQAAVEHGVSLMNVMDAARQAYEKKRPS